MYILLLVIFAHNVGQLLIFTFSLILHLAFEMF